MSKTSPKTIVITSVELKEVLDYEESTGFFYWKIRKQGVKFGSIVGTLSNGYIVITINGRLFRAHRLAYLYTYGYLPENEIDHIDRNKSNNRIDNLREVSRYCNLKNTGNRKNNTSGIKGVSFHKSRNKWEVYISIDRKTRSLGSHKSLTEAVCHRLAAEQCADWSSCDSYSPAAKYVFENVTNPYKDRTMNNKKNKTNLLYHLGLPKALFELACKRYSTEECLNWKIYDSNSSSAIYIKRTIIEPYKQFLYNESL